MSARTSILAYAQRSGTFTIPEAERDLSISKSLIRYHVKKMLDAQELVFVAKQRSGSRLYRYVDTRPWWKFWGKA